MDVTGTVSYTHLDVYKRQAVGWLFWELQLWSGWRWFGNAGTGTALFLSLIHI